MAGASPEGRSGTAVGSILLLPFTDHGYSAPAGGVPCLGLATPGQIPKLKTFPSPHMVLRLPAEMQLKQLIF